MHTYIYLSYIHAYYIYIYIYIHSLLASGCIPQSSTEPGGPSARHAAFSSGGGPWGPPCLWGPLWRGSRAKTQRAPHSSTTAAAAAAAAAATAPAAAGTPLLKASSSRKGAPKNLCRGPQGAPSSGPPSNPGAPKVRDFIIIKSICSRIKKTEKRLLQQHATQAAESSSSSRDRERAPTTAAASTHTQTKP